MIASHWYFLRFKYCNNLQINLFVITIEPVSLASYQPKKNGLSIMTTTQGKKSRAAEKIKIFIVEHVNFYAPFYLTIARMQADKNSDIKQVDFVLSGTDEKVIYNIYKEERDDNTFCIALCEPIFERKNGEENLHIEVDDERITFKDLKDDLDHYPFVNRLPMWGIADLELLKKHKLIDLDNVYRFRQLFQSSSNISLAEIKQNLGLLKNNTSLHIYTYPEGSTLNKESKRLFDFTQKNVTLHAEKVREVFKPIEQNKNDQPWIVFTVEPLAGFEINSHNKNIGLVYASAPRLTTATSIICHKEAREKWGGRVKTLLDNIELVTADFYDSINFSDKFSKQSFGILYEYKKENGWTYSPSIPQKDIDPKDKLEFSIYQNDRIYTFDIKQESKKWEEVFTGITESIQKQTTKNNQSEIFRDKKYNPKNLRDDKINFIDEIAIVQESKTSGDGNLEKTAKFMLGTLSRLHNAQQVASKKSAIAAIISRNMSHNLGSHVINYLKNTVDLMGQALCCGAALEDKPIFNFDATKLDIDKSSLKILEDSCVWGVIENGSQVVRSFLETSLYAFLEYINRRMEFIATLTTSVPSTPVTINLKKEIWDIINKEKNYLLEFIAKSEIGSKPELEFKAKGLDIDNLQVAIPDGIVGAQGFYTIVENFIRNSAKHGFSGSTRRQLTIKVDVSREDNDFYKVRLSNNFGDGKELLKYYSKQGNELYREKCDNEFIINPRFIDNTGNLVHSSWGIKEMFIGACYLRGLTPKEYNLTNHEPPIMQVGIDDCCNVIYTFYLFKPKPFIVVTTEDCKKYANFENFAKYGVDKFIFEDLAQGNQFIRHSFCLLHECFSQCNGSISDGSAICTGVKDDGYNVDWINRNENFLPYRIFCDCHIDPADRYWAKWDTSWNNETCFSKFYQNLYKRWIEAFYEFEKNDFPRLIILDYQEASQLKKKLTNAEGIALLSSNDKGAVAGLTDNDSLKHAVIFCDHLRKNKQKYSKIRTKLECKGIKTSWEEISSSNSTFRIVGDLGKDVHGIGKYQLIESCLASVVIIDERIYNNCEQGLYDFNWDWREIRVFNYDQEKGQFTSKHNGDTATYHSKNETVNPNNRFNLDFIRQNGKKVDFFVIHRGIIEKILEQDNSMETIAFLKNLKNIAKHIVIVSGRGKPPYIDDSWYVRFTNLENLYHWFFDCKTSLVMGLFSLINRKGE